MTEIRLYQDYGILPELFAALEEAKSQNNIKAINNITQSILLEISIVQDQTFLSPIQGDIIFYLPCVF